MNIKTISIAICSIFCLSGNLVSSADSRHHLLRGQHNKMAANTGVITSPTGLKYQDVQVGTGASPRQGQIVVVHYTGKLTNGEKFDSSVDRGQPFEFPLGQGRVIKGWDEGIASMKVGGKRILTIPADLAYGARSPSPKIPPNSVLVFDVELLGVK